MPDLALPQTFNLNLDGNLALFTMWGLQVLSAILVLMAGWIIGNYAKSLIAKIKKLDATLKFFLGGLAKYTVFIVSIITVLGQFGVQTASLIAVLGGAALAIGLAMQGTLSNVAAGVMLLILRPFNVGDYIEADNVKGTVKELGLFATEMATLDNIFIFVPNNQLWNSDIRNLSRNLHRRSDINVSISYDDDIAKAMKLIHKVLADEDRLIQTETKKPDVFVNVMGPSAIELIVRYWTTNSDTQIVKSDLTRLIKEKLEDSKIYIPHVPLAAPAEKKTV